MHKSLIVVSCRGTVDKGVSYTSVALSMAGNCERERKEKLQDLKTAGKGATSIFAYLR